jgi:hypothetical protein
MSVPMRDQSRASAPGPSVRIQVCKSGDVELHFLTGYRPLAARVLIGLRENAIDDRVEGGEVRVQALASPPSGMKMIH